MKVFTGESAEICKTRCGTANYMAPELFGNTGEEREYDGTAVDIFACGVILFMMLTGKQPFN